MVPTGIHRCLHHQDIRVSSRNGRIGSHREVWWVSHRAQTHAWVQERGTLSPFHVVPLEGVPTRQQGCFEGLHSLNGRHLNGFDAGMTQIPDLQPSHGLFPVVSDIPEHGVHFQLLHIIAGTVVRSQARFEVNDDGLPRPTVNKIILTLEPMVRMHGVHREGRCIGVHEPRASQLPRFSSNDSDPSHAKGWPFAKGA